MYTCLPNENLIGSQQNNDRIIKLNLHSSMFPRKESCKVETGLSKKLKTPQLTPQVTPQ